MGRVDPWFAALTVLYMAGLFYLSSLPGSATGPNTPGWRLASNAAHVPLFAGLAVSLALTLRRWPPRLRAVGVLVIAVAYAAFDEWHQTGVAGRSASLVDVGLDLGGILLGMPAITLWRGDS